MQEPWGCTTLELNLAGEHQSISLPFGVRTCAQINISAWRPGKCDGDPQNVVYAKSEAKNPIADLPKDCAKADFSKLGRPVTVQEEEGMAFALSTAPASVSFGDPVPLNLWIDNQTDKQASVWSCMTLDFFWAEGFDVYDAYGHRLLRKNGRKNRQGSRPASR
jgi:hypothetical protein